MTTSDNRKVRALTTVELYEDGKSDLTGDGAGFITNLYGEEGLLAAILYRAVLDLDPLIEARHRRTARGWILSNERKKEGSITYLETCEVLGIRPIAFRLRLEREGKIKL